MVDCGVTEHVITDNSKFINFDQNFEPGNHFLKLADGSWKEEMPVSIYAIAMDTFVDVSWKILYIYQQNIYYNGAHISFEQDNSQLIYPNKAVVIITQRGHFYYLKNIVSARNAS